MTDVRTLQMTLQHAGDRVSVNWQTTDGSRNWDPYDVAELGLSMASEKIRRELSDLQNLDWSDAERWQPEDAAAMYGDILQRLASAGEDLYKALFTGHPREPASQEDAANFRAWFEENVLGEMENAWRIQVVHMNFARAIVPWGLAYAPTLNASKSPETLDPTYENYSGFWCSKFRLACRGPFANEISKPSACDGEMAQFVAVIEAEEDIVDQFSTTARREWSSEQGIKPDYVVHEKLDLQKHARSGTDMFWYVSLRAHGGNLTLGGQPIRVHDAMPANEKLNLMLIDGDAVIRHDRGTDWVKICLNMGESGLIAAETDITNDSMRFFGWEMLKQLVRGREPTRGTQNEEASKSLPLIDAMEAARRELWPRSLLYGVYCNPLHVYLDPAPHRAIETVNGFLKNQYGDSA